MEAYDLRVLSNRQMKFVENRAKEDGIDFIKLMENAGSECANIIIKEISSFPKNPKIFTIVCGNGKNGGDGFVIARKLAKMTSQVNIILASGSAKDSDAVQMYKQLSSLPINIIKYNSEKVLAAETILNSDVIIDALFGTGFKGCPNIETTSLIQIVNSSRSYKFSIDIPSGVVCDTGEIPGENINADTTIVISALKPAHILLPGSHACGKLIIADIGISEKHYNGIDNGVFYTLDEVEIKNYFPKIEPFAHKGNFGHILSICGSKTMQGAAVISAKGASRSGAGLVTAAFPDCAYSAIGSKLTEQLLLPLNSNKLGTFSISAIPKVLEAALNSNAVLVGCGIGINSDTKKLVKEIIKNINSPIIIDADGLNLIADDLEVLKYANNSVIITPHPGEMSRLTGLSISEIQLNRLEIAKNTADKLNVIVVLKGANTVVAQPNEEFVYVNPTGNAGMAKGGSGDFLAGIIASFVAQGLSAGDAARAAVYIHGLTGDISAKKLSKRGLTVTSCIEELPLVMARFED